MLNRSAFELSNYEIGDDSVFLSSSTDEADSSLSPSTSAAAAAGLPLPPPPPSRPPKPPHLAAMQSALAAAASNSGTGRADNYANSTDMAELAAETKNVIEESKSKPKPTNWPVPPPPREKYVDLVFKIVKDFERLNLEPILPNESRFEYTNLIENGELYHEGN